VTQHRLILIVLAVALVAVVAAWFVAGSRTGAPMAEPPPMERVGPVDSQFGTRQPPQN